MNNGPLAVLKGSHKNDLYDQYDKNGNWTGMLSDEDADIVDMSMVDYLTEMLGLLQYITQEHFIFHHHRDLNNQDHFYLIVTLLLMRRLIHHILNRQLTLIKL